MMIIPIIVGILIPLMFLALIGGVAYIIIQKKQAANSEIPQKQIHFSDIVSNFFTLAFLITNVVAVITIIFSIVDKLISDPLSRLTYYEISNNNEALHSAISLIAITLPASLILSYWMRKQQVARNEQVNSPIRKFTIGTTIVATALTISGSIFSIIYQYLEGDISSRFLAKVSSVLLIAIILFVYYRMLYRTELAKAVKYQNAFAYSTSIIVIGLCIYGIAITGSPSQIRKEKFDDRRLSDLSQIQQQVVSYWQNHHMLPEKLSTISDPLSQFAVPTDPKTNATYKYEIVTQSIVSGNEISPATFKLCSTFETKRETTQVFEGVTQAEQVSKDTLSSNAFEGYYLGSESPFWNHEIGEKCFTRTIDPKVYKPSTNPILKD